MADHIAKPNPTGYTSFDTPGTATHIATPPAGSVGPVATTDTTIAAHTAELADHEARITALETP